MKGKQVFKELGGVMILSTPSIDKRIQFSLFEESNSRNFEKNKKVKTFIKQNKYHYNSYRIYFCDKFFRDINTNIIYYKLSQTNSR